MLFTNTQAYLDKLDHHDDDDTTLTLDRIEHDDAVPDRIDSSHEVSVQHGSSTWLEPPTGTDATVPIKQEPIDDEGTVHLGTFIDSTTDPEAFDASNNNDNDPTTDPYKIIAHDYTKNYDFSDKTYDYSLQTP